MCSILNKAVYATRDNDAYRNGHNTTMEQRLAGSLKEAEGVLADCHVTTIPQKIIVEDAAP